MPITIPPSSLLATPLGSGRRLNIIREWMQLGLIPVVVYDKSIRQWSSFNFKQLSDMTDNQRLDENIIQVYYHPVHLQRILNRNTSFWFDQSRDIADKPEAGSVSSTYRVTMVPDVSLHSFLRATNVVGGGARRSISLIDFNLVAYMLATLTEGWKDQADVLTLNKFKSVLYRTGNIQTKVATLPQVDLNMGSDDPSVAAVLAQVKASTIPQDPNVAAAEMAQAKALTATLPQDLAKPSTFTVVNRVPRPDTFLPDVETLDMKNISDLDALILRAQEEKARRKSTAILDRWLGATVTDVNISGGVVTNITLRLNDQTEMDFEVGSNRLRPQDCVTLEADV